MNKLCLCMTGIYLVIMAVIDIRTKEIPVAPGVVFMVLAAIARLFGGADWISLVSGLFVGIFLYIVSCLSGGKVGRGDALVYAVTGMTLGFVKNAELFLCSLFLASMGAIVLIVVRRVGKNYAMPFVPFTAAAFGVVLCL